MRYLLNPACTFCGWEDLPYALLDKSTKEVRFLSKEQFAFLWGCDGCSDVDLASYSEADRDGICGLMKDGIISEAAGSSHLRLHSYKKYPCCYRMNVQLSLTGKCNYCCRHCFQSAPHGVLGQPTTKEVLEELDQLVECGVFKISLTGGEPLIHPGFWDIVDGIIKRGLVLTVVYSNGALVDQKLIDGFIRRGIKPGFAISFDGIGCHDELRGVSGAEKKALDAIKLLVSNDFRVSCGYTLTKKSIKVFRESANMLASLGVGSIKSGWTMPAGEWLSHKELWLTDEEYLNFYKTYIPQYLEDGKPLCLQFEGLFASDCGKDGKYGFPREASIKEEDFSKSLCCMSVADSFYIGPGGRVLPCMGMDGTPAGESFDTLREKPLKEILSKGSWFIRATAFTMADVFDHNSEECGHCDQRTHCGSGCRANALAFTGDDYLALDKRNCTLCKENWAGKVKECIKAE